MTGIEGKVAVVTGGGQGIGAAVARSLARHGARVVVVARTEARIEAVAGEITASGGETIALPCDVTDEARIEALREAVAGRWGGADILVNNAGMATSAALHNETLEQWERVFAVNVRGVFLASRAFVPGMVERGWGRVVNVASIAGLHGGRYMSTYAASKHAVVGFTRSIAADVAARGVTVNAVCPGYVDTPMTDLSVERIVAKTGKSAEEARAAILTTTPQRRLIEPEEVAFSVVSLCSHEARGINGETVVIDGGALAGGS